MTTAERAHKIALAFLVTFLCVHYMGFHERSWPLITLVVLMVPAEHKKHVWSRAAQRIAGTFIGACIGSLALYIERVSFVGMLPVVVFGVWLAVYFSRSRFPYCSTVVAITMAVVVNAPAGDLHTAIARVCGIAIGAVFATIFSVIL